MRTLAIALVALAIVATPVLAASAPDAALDLVSPKFVDCSLYHIGLFLSTGNPVHLTHPVTICLFS